MTTSNEISFSIPTNTATNGSSMQSITNATCPTSPVWVVDGRDNHTYYIKKMEDGLCWMVTNLGYAGGGTNTNGDTKSITYWDRSSDYFGGSSSNAYLAPYFTDTGSGKDSATAYTTSPTAPSTTTGTGGQYGYLYNWCAAMGGQTNACNSSSTSGFDTTISICPAGWRLPVGGAGASTSGNASTTNNEFAKLDIAMGGTGTNRDSANTYSNWMSISASSMAWGGVLSGLYTSSSLDTGSRGLWWSSTAYGSTYAYLLGLNPSSSYVAPANYFSKYGGFAVRCVL
jgi:uncharacterized protein (TIGR02145 family)